MLTLALVAVGVAAILGLSPVAARLVDRVAVLGTAALAVGPLLWWWPLSWPVPRLWVVGVGVLVGSLALSWWRSRRGAPADPGTGVDVRIRAKGGVEARAREVVKVLPTVRAGEAVGLALTLPTLWLLAPWWDPRLTPIDLVDRFLHAFDWVGHFEMANHALAAGVILPQAPLSPLGDWFYGHYPAGLHAGVATVMEALGARPGATLDNLPAFAQGTAVILYLALVVLTCVIMGLPWVRDRRYAAPLAAAGVLAMLLLGQASVPALLLGGYPNFVLAVVAASIALLATVGWVAPGWRVPLTIASALVVIAHNWLLLLPGAGLAVGVALWVRRRELLGSRAGWAQVLISGVVAGTGSLAAVSQLGVGESHLTVDGGFTAKVLWPTVLALVVLGLVLLALGRGGGSGLGWREAVVAATSLVIGLGAAAYVVSLQVERWGTITYYGWKLLVGLQLIATVAAVALAPSLAPLLAGSRAAAGRMARAALAVVVIFVVVGGVLRQGLPKLGEEGQRALDARRTFATSDFQRPRTEDLIAAAAALRDEPQPYVFLRPRLAEDRDQTQNMSWILALTLTWSKEADVVNHLLALTVPLSGPERQKPRDVVLQRLRELAPEGTLVTSERTDPSSLEPSRITVTPFRR